MSVNSKQQQAIPKKNFFTNLGSGRLIHTKKQ